MSHDEKKPKLETEDCLKQDSIPIDGVTRMLHFKVSGEAQAIEAEAILKKIHAIFKSDVKGFVSAHRFVCKEHWDVKYYARFASLEAIVEYMEGKVKTDKVEPLIKEIEDLIKQKTASQNFVADDWN